MPGYILATISVSENTITVLANAAIVTVLASRVLITIQLVTRFSACGEGDSTITWTHPPQGPRDPRISPPSFFFLSQRATEFCLHRCSRRQHYRQSKKWPEVCQPQIAKRGNRKNRDFHGLGPLRSSYPLPGTWKDVLGSHFDFSLVPRRVETRTHEGKEQMPNVHPCYSFGET